jgi:hypothetical protein
MGQSETAEAEPAELQGLKERKTHLLFPKWWDPVGAMTVRCRSLTSACSADGDEGGSIQVMVTLRDRGIVRKTERHGNDPTWRRRDSKV